MPTQETIFIWTDGGARGNPGPAGIGAVIAKSSNQPLGKQETIGEIARYIGETTNNQAEYRALVAALEWVNAYLAGVGQLPAQVALYIYTDSELLAYQLQGRYKVKNGELKPLFDHIQSTLKPFGAVTIQPISREKNQVADRLVNKAIDAANV